MCLGRALQQGAWVVVVSLIAPLQQGVGVFLNLRVDITCRDSTEVTKRQTAITRAALIMVVSFLLTKIHGRLLFDTLRVLSCSLKLMLCTVGILYILIYSLLVVVWRSQFFLSC